MQRKKLYDRPQADITELLVSDIITTSGASVPPSGGGSGNAPGIGDETGNPEWDLPWD